jgi:O-antigen/teichoic acid export membrane protein
MNFQKQIAQSIIWRGLYFVTVLIINIFLSRYFQAGNVGWIFYLSNNFSFLLILAGLNIETGISYYSSQKKISDSSLAWFSLVWSLAASFIVFTVLWFYFGRYKDTTSITRSEYLFYGICYIAGIQLTNIFTVLFYANKDFFLPNFLMVLLNLILIFIIPKNTGVQNSNGAHFIHLYFAFFVLNGVTLAIAFIIEKRSWQKIKLPQYADIRLIVRYALMALVANVVFFLVYRVDYWFVKKYCTAEELGNYIQISKLAQMLLIIPGIISSVVFPHTAGGMERGEMKENIFRIGRITSILYMVLFVLLALLGKWMFPVVFGNSFNLMHLPFLLLMPGIWALSNLSILSAYFAGINKVKVNVQGAAAALIVILIGDMLFIPKGGIIAAAIVSTVGYFVNFLYSFLILQHEHPVSLNQYWAINKDDIRWLKSFTQR